MREVDRIMTDELGIDLTLMMENAGRHLSDLCRRLTLDGDATGRRVVVLAGPGGNGGGALVAARRLHGWGADVLVVVSAAERFRAVPEAQLHRVERLGIAVHRAADVAAVDDGVPIAAVLDGVIGYSLDGPPVGDAESSIRWANRAGAPIISLDVPSGLDATTGRTSEPTINAIATLTLAVPKIGLRGAEVRSTVGDLYLADIGVPAEVVARADIEGAEGLFSVDEMIRIW